MDFTTLPWKEGLTTAFACVLLKLLYDAVYVKLPEGFTAVKEELTRQNAAAEVRHSATMEHQGKLVLLLDRLERKLAVKPRLKKPRRKKS